MSLHPISSKQFDMGNSGSGRESSVILTEAEFTDIKVKVTPGMPKFEAILGVSVDDQFTEGAKLFDLTKPTRLCNPVSKDGEGIKNDAAHLMCYQAKPAEGQPKHVKVSGIHVNNQFGPEQLDTVKEEELCVPSEKIVGGGG